MAGFVAAAVVGSALIGSKASKSAAQTQAGASAAATDAQERMFERQVELQEPFREAGMAGQNRLMQLLGLSTKPKELRADASEEEKNQYARDLAEYNALTGSKDYGRYASAEFGGVKGFDPTSLMKNFSQSDFQTDPGYAFRLSEGMKALDRTAASRGGLLSGATLKGAQRYGSDLASQEYTNAFNRFQANRASQSGEFQNAFNRFQTERTNTLNPYASLAGVAQSSANTLTGAAGTLGQQIGSNIIGAGNAAAAGQVGSANAIAQGVGQGINFYQGQQYLNRLPNYNAPTMYGPPSSAMMPY